MQSKPSGHDQAGVPDDSPTPMRKRDILAQGLSSIIGKIVAAPEPAKLPDHAKCTEGATGSPYVGQPGEARGTGEALLPVQTMEQQQALQLAACRMDAAAAMMHQNS